MDSDLPSMDDMAEFEVSSPTVPAEKSDERIVENPLNEDMAALDGITLATTQTDDIMEAKRRKALVEREERAGMDKMVYMEANGTRTNVFILFAEPDSSVLARIVGLVMMVFILASSVSLVIETIESVKSDAAWVTMLHLFEIVCVVVFTLEYLTRLATCTARPGPENGFFGYVVEPMNLIDLMSVLPFYIELMMNAEDGGMAVLRMLRMARVFRVMKLGTYATELGLFVKGYHRSAEGLTLLMFMMLLYLCVFGTFLWMLEYADQVENGNDGFTSIPTTWYFILATITTVGYGDHYPGTWQGKLMCTVCMFCGILVLALPIMIIGNSFEEVFEEEAQLKADRDIRKKRLDLQREADLQGHVAQGDVQRADGKPIDSDEPEFSKAGRRIIRPPAKGEPAVKDLSNDLFSDEDIPREVQRKTAVHAAQHLLEALFEETGDTRFKRASQSLLE